MCIPTSSTSYTYSALLYFLISLKTQRGTWSRLSNIKHPGYLTNVITKTGGVYSIFPDLSSWLGKL
jgi:hypothetical protein